MGKVGWHGALLGWTRDEPARTVVSLRAAGREHACLEMGDGATRRHAIRLGRLRKGTTYVVRIGAADAEGHAAWSAPHSLRTKG